MESSDILMQARAGSETTHDWVVLPLVRRKVLWGMAGWACGILLGVGLFAAMASIVIPYNYQHGLGPALFSTIFLGVLLFVALGSAWALMIDVRRLSQADKHLIVITPDVFVKQEGEKIISVPLMYVRHVTARGAPPPDRSVENARVDRQVPGAGESVVGMLVGRGFTPSGMRYR